jgi:hypothetical protein
MDLPLTRAWISYPSFSFFLFFGPSVKPLRFSFLPTALCRVKNPLCFSTHCSKSASSPVNGVSIKKFYRRCPLCHLLYFFSSLPFFSSTRYPLASVFLSLSVSSSLFIHVSLISLISSCLLFLCFALVFRKIVHPRNQQWPTLILHIHREGIRFCADQEAKSNTQVGLTRDSKYFADRTLYFNCSVFSDKGEH